MLAPRKHTVISRSVAYSVLLYGLLLIAGALVRQLHSHQRHEFASLFSSLPLLIGLSFVYLANLLLRLKYNAWLVSTALAGGTALFNLFSYVRHEDDSPSSVMLVRVAIALALFMLLILSRNLFRVRSDARSFTQAARVSFVVLLIAFLYGVGGFSLLDKKDFHQEIHIGTAMHQTVDQFGLTTRQVVPHTRRAHLFVDSLSVISTGAIAYAALSFFQPLRMQLINQTRQREQAERLLRDYPGDIDDFFKVWPHDKHYFFSKNEKAGLAYHVSRGVALVAADPFGDKRSFGSLLQEFEELCFVNDWQPCFIHTDQKYRKLYERHGYRLQKIGEEAVLDVGAFMAAKRSKYFRQITNRFIKLGYTVELVEPPHSAALLRRLQEISDEWLKRPGREERGFMLGYFSEEYMQQGPIAIVRDEAQQIQGFINLVPTYTEGTANYDLLRCSDAAPGNCNDFLLLGLLESLHAQGITTFNLGLCPLSGMDEKAENASIIDSALRFVYANGDRFYSFSGLRRFKAKYEPEWHPRYVAYKGGLRGFTRGMTALTRAMKVK